MQKEIKVDPVCLYHGKKLSKHRFGFCLTCLLCYKPLSFKDCHILDTKTDTKEDVCNECFYTEQLNVKKIYFTVKTDFNTYYFVSDCQESLQVDIQDLMYNLFENETYDDWTVFSDSCCITFSNQLPKGILFMNKITLSISKNGVFIGYVLVSNFDQESPPVCTMPKEYPLKWSFDSLYNMGYRMLLIG